MFLESLNHVLRTSGRITARRRKPRRNTCLIKSDKENGKVFHLDKKLERQLCDVPKYVDIAKTNILLI